MQEGIHIKPDTKEKRKRDSEEDTTKREEDKRRRTDSYQDNSNRKEATQKALDILLGPHDREQTPREQEVYQQSIEEVKRLNTGDYAINAHNNGDLALYAARRAHLKALFYPGEFPDEGTENAWKPGGKWAKRAITAGQYEHQLEQAKSKHQQLEQECPIAALNSAIRYSESNKAISIYKRESQQEQQRRYENLKARLGTIRDYFEGKPIGIVKADSAWGWIKEAQAKSNYLAIVDLRQLLNLPRQETTSSFPDQGSRAFNIPETVPPQLRDVEMKSPDYDLAQQQFEQFQRHAEDMLKALPDNEFKTTSQARFDALLTTYTTMTPDTATTSQLQKIYTQMKNFHKDLAQQQFEQSRRDAHGLLEVLPTDEFKTTNQERLNALITTYTTMTPDTTTPSQLQDVSTQMKNLHYVLRQQQFEQLRRYAKYMLKALPDNAFKTTNQERYTSLITSYKKIDLVNRIPSELQEVSTQMMVFCKDLIQRHFEYTQERLRGDLEGIVMPDFPETFQNRFNDLQQTYQRVTDVSQRRDVHLQMIDLHMEVLQQNFLRYQSLTQKIEPNFAQLDKDTFEKLVQEHKEVPYEDKIPRNQQQMVNLYDRIMHFYQGQATDLFDKARVYLEEALPSMPDEEDLFQTTSKERYDTLKQIDLANAPINQLQDSLDKMIALHHVVTQWHFQESKAKIEILFYITQKNDLVQENNVKAEFNSLTSKWDTLESKRNDSVHLSGEQDIIDYLLDVEHSMIQTFYKQQTKAPDDLLKHFNSSESKAQFKDLESERDELASSWDNQELEWANLSSQQYNQRYNLDQRHNILDKLLNYHRRLANTIYEQTQSRIERLLPMLAEDAFRQTSQTRYNSIIEARPQGDIAIDNLQERARISQTWQKVVVDLLDLHSDLAQETIKQTHTSVEQFLQQFQMKPQAEFEALTKRCRADLFSPNTRPTESPANERPIGDWQKNEKNTKANANDWQEVVDDLLHFHNKLASNMYQYYHNEFQEFLRVHKDFPHKIQFQNQFDILQAEYSASTNPGQKQLVLQKMGDQHKDLLPWDFQWTYSDTQRHLDQYIKDHQHKTQFQQDLDALQSICQTISNMDIQNMKQSLDKINNLRGTVIDCIWKEQFQQLQAKIDQLLQGLQEDVIEDGYRKTYAQLKQAYEKLSQGGQKLGTSSATNECYGRMALFHQDLLGVSEMNRRHNEIKDDTKEMEHYTNEVEKKFQRHIGQVHRVWSAENGQDQPITYAQFTDPEGKEYPEEVVEAVNGTDTKTGKAVKGHYCPKTQHFLSSDRQTVHDAQLIDEGQQLRFKDTRETPWEHQLLQWAKPAGTQVRLALEDAKQRIWKVLSRDKSQTQLELSLDLHGSYLSKTMNAGTDADIHVAFKNNPLNNPFYNDLLKYRDIMNNALIKAFEEQNVAIEKNVVIGQIVTTINEKAFGKEADVFPAFYHTFEGGHKGLISFTEDKQIITHFLEQKRQNAQAKSERTVYQFRSMVRIIKNMRKKVGIDREAIPSFIIEALVYNTPNDHFVDSPPEGEPSKRDLADTLNRVLKHCIEHTATDEACQEWTEVDGIKYLFNHAANTPWTMEMKGVTYTYPGTHDISREQTHDFLKQLQAYTQTQQEDQFQSIQLSRPLEVSRSLPERPLFAINAPTIGSH